MKSSSFARTAGVYALLFFTVILLALPVWLRKHIGETSLEQMLFFMRNGTQGTAREMYYSIACGILLPAVAVCGAYAAARAALARPGVAARARELLAGVGECYGLLTGRYLGRVLGVVALAVLAGVFFYPDSQPPSPFYLKAPAVNYRDYIVSAPGLGEDPVAALSAAAERGVRFFRLDFYKLADGTLSVFPDRPPVPGRDMAAVREVLQRHPGLCLLAGRVFDFDLLQKELPLPERLLVVCETAGQILDWRRNGYFPHNLAVYAEISGMDKVPQELHVIRHYNFLGVSYQVWLTHARYLELRHRQGLTIAVYDVPADTPEPLLQEMLGRSADLVIWKR